MDDKQHTVLIYKAKTAEKAERYEDMVEAIKEFSNEKKVLDTEQRNLLSVAYKNVIGSKRAAWRALSVAADKDPDNSIIKEYRGEVEKELRETCNEVVELLEKVLIPNAKTPECEVFFNKMIADYWRYAAEFSKDSTDISNSEGSYSKAFERAKDLSSTHPIKLGLALNFSVFHYEINNDPNKACNVAKEAFDDAIGNLEELSEEHYKDSTLIMQLLRDNLTLWTSDRDEDEDN